jgi:hypothetical protein
MEQLGQTQGLNTARRGLAGCRNTNSCLAFGGYDTVDVTGATEEYDGSTLDNNPKV